MELLWLSLPGVMSYQVNDAAFTMSSAFPSSVPPIQTASLESIPATTGTVMSKLNTTGHPTDVPVRPATRIGVSANPETPTPVSINAFFASPSAAVAPNIFAPVDMKPPPVQFKRMPSHPAKGVNLMAKTPTHTNRFYTNLFIGNQLSPIFTHPYSLQFTVSNQQSALSGMSISHVSRTQTVFGPKNPSKYYLNPIGIRSIVFSSADLGGSPVLFSDSPKLFSINAYLSSAAGQPALIGFPIVQGMGFVTSLWYGNTTPLLRSGVFFQSLVAVGNVNSLGTYKYRILLADGNSWLIYATPSSVGESTVFVLKNSSAIQGAPNFYGSIQIAKLPMDSVAAAAAEKTFDKSAGTYATQGVLSGTVSGTTGQYSISWTKDGLPSPRLIMYLLPHQVQSLSSQSRKDLTQTQLDTTTKGKATAILANQVTFVERNLATLVLFDPYSPNGVTKSLSASARRAVIKAAAIEIAQNFTSQLSRTSMYWNGKALSKFAMLAYATHSFGLNDTLTSVGLQKLKRSYSQFVDNTLTYPLVYDQQWGGIVSSASYDLNDPNYDYGNSYYNDHHFHFGYFVYAAAVIAYLDRSWLTSKNRDFVNTLIRDYANSVETDQYFPMSRNFDWWHGHSWADGLFQSGDSKNEESSSEDVFSIYAIKMWGKVIGDPNMEARGNLQLAILRRSLQSYFLMQSSNSIHPEQFVGNKAVGIFFENKVDHSTYFGQLPEYVEGIHMLPLAPPSGYVRSPTFVSEEWATYFSEGRADAVSEPWRSILYANLALTDPKTSWAYFNSPQFDWMQVDNGASWTWYLAYAAGLGGAS